MSVLDAAKVGPPALQIVVRFVHAEPRDARSLRSWRRIARSIANPSARDSADLAKAAFAKWSQCRRERRAANSLRDALDLIRNNPHEEVGMLVLAKSTIAGAAMAGLCHFRRTWCNNVMIDFLAVHPREVRSEQSRFKGLGSCFLWYVAEFADELEAETLWLEATQNSAPAYQRIFGLKAVKDLVVLSRNQYTVFRDSMRQAQGVKS